MLEPVLCPAQHLLPVRPRAAWRLSCLQMRLCSMFYDPCGSACASVHGCDPGVVLIVQFSAVRPAQAQLQSGLAAEAARLREEAGGGAVSCGQEQGVQLPPKCSIRAVCWPGSSAMLLGNCRRPGPAANPRMCLVLVSAAIGVMHGPVATLVALVGSPVASRRVPAGRLAVAVLWTGPAAPIACAVMTHIPYGHVARVARSAGCSGPGGPSVHRPDFRHLMTARTHSSARRRHTENVPFACDGTVHADVEALLS